MCEREPFRSAGSHSSSSLRRLAHNSTAVEASRRSQSEHTDVRGQSNIPGIWLYQLLLYDARPYGRTRFGPRTNERMNERTKTDSRHCCCCCSARNGAFSTDATAVVRKQKCISEHATQTTRPRSYTWHTSIPNSQQPRHPTLLLIAYQVPARTAVHSSRF